MVGAEKIIHNLFMKFTLFSIRNVFEGLKVTARRFPLSLFSAFAGTIIGIIIIHRDEPSLYLTILLTLTLAFPLFTSIVLVCEKKLLSFRKKAFINVSAVVFLILYYVWLPDSIINSENIFIIRHILWSVGFFLLITFAPFLAVRKEGAINAFWQYNKSLFFAFLLTYIWATAMQTGLSIAIMSVDLLFDISIDTTRYMELWAIIFGVFSTTFFLSRVPPTIEGLLDKKDYPKELRLFAQYVLIPLVAIYFFILYAYVFRILITSQWPKGVLAYMILGFSLLGVFTYACTYPLRESVAWIRKTGNIFYIVLIPQIGMLFWALYFRLSQYGFTENRYFVFVFGWWLLVMALYLLISKKKDIRFIPVTIFIIAILSSFGQWGAFAVSEKSQIHRLEKMLIKNNLLVNGKIKKLENQEVSLDDRKEISGIIRYLYQVHTLSGIQTWFIQDLSTFGGDETQPKKRDAYAYPQKVTRELLGIEYVEAWQAGSIESETFSFYVDEYLSDGKITDISRYDFMASLYNLSGNIRQTDDVIYKYAIDNSNGEFIMLKNDEVIARADIKVFLNNLLKVRNSYPPPIDRDLMKLEFENENISLALYFTNINGEKKESGIYHIQSLNGRLFFTPKTP